jgi:nucleotide-binding universal stress UspA family protein
MYSRILVPLDGSQLSETILPYARTLSKTLRLPVELLKVNDPDKLTAFSPPMQGGDYLRGVAETLPAGAEVHSSIELGEPAEVIVDIGAADSKSLIAMATRGHSGVERWYLGSVTNKVLHAAPNPLLLVRETDNQKIHGEATLKKLVVLLDGSDVAELVLPHVENLARAMELEVILVRVNPMPIEPPMTEVYPLTMDSIIEQCREEAKAYLEKKTEELRAKGLERVSHVLLEGNVAGEIIDFAQKTLDNIVAMTTHGRSGVTRWLLGSVADKVIRHSGDPVLVVRATAPSSKINS